MGKNRAAVGKRVLWIHNFPKKSGGGGGWMYNQLEFLEDEVDDYYLDNLRNPISFFRHWRNLITLSKKYQIAHAQYGSAVGFLTSRMRCSKILSLKGSDWYKAPNPSLFHKIRIVMGSLLTKISVPRFDLLIVMSDRMNREVKRKFPGANVITLVDPIDLKRFIPKPRKITGTTRILFASVDVNNPVKRFDLAKKSVDLLIKKCRDAELVIMTKIPHEEVCEFMNQTDVLLLTSTHEGWPNVVKEMLACNKPFVSTKVSDLSQIAKKTTSCFAVEPTPEALCEALFKSIHADPENLRILVKNFEMKNYVRKIKNLYDQFN